MVHIQQQETEQRILSQLSLSSDIFCSENEIANSFIAQSPFDYAVYIPANLETLSQNDQNFLFSSGLTKTDSLNSFNFAKKVPSVSDSKDFSFQEPKAENDENLLDIPCHSHNLRPKKNDYRPPLASINITDTASDDLVKCKRKRPYFSKRKHSKEVLEKVAEERLQRKRLKNRELAAKSRKKRKERMEFLEEEYIRLSVENKALKSELKKLKKVC